MNMPRFKSVATEEPSRFSVVFTPCAAKRLCRPSWWRWAEASAIGVLIGFTVRATPAPVASWDFEENSAVIAHDRVSGRDDEIRGYSARVPGAEGRALRFDGYTTEVTRSAAAAPEVNHAATFEVWLALQAYPWGPCALLTQSNQAPVKIEATDGMINLTPDNTPKEPVPTAGYFFGLDSDGRISLQLALDGHWTTCRADRGIPLMRWTHVAGTYDARAGEIALFVNGEKVASTPARGTITVARNEDLAIGRNPHARLIDHQIRLGIPGNFGVEGLLDEIRIYDHALSPLEIRASMASAHPPADSGLRPPTLPEVGPAPGGFGAYYTRLKFEDAWDAPRRDGPDSDVVVLFDRHPWKLMFWRGTNYIPHWVTENGIWYTNEFNETWGYGVLGCAEPMSDKQTRFSRVSIVENTPARVVVHWRYALVDTRYDAPHVDPQSGWSDWSDEYHIIYPDGIGVRKICLWSSRPRTPHEYQESIVLIPAGKRPEDMIETEAVTTANLQGETHTYSWAAGAPHKIDQPVGANIEVINVRSKAKPFVVVSDEPFELYGEKHTAPAFRPMDVEIDRARSIFPWWNHWPVAQIPSDGRSATHPDRTAHSSLTTGLEWKDWSETTDSRTRIMLQGLTELPAKQLVTVARSWLRAPSLAVRSGTIRSLGYDQSERAYILMKDETGPSAGADEMVLNATADSPLLHPAFIVRRWGDRGVRVSAEGQRLSDSTVRTGLRRTLESVDLIVWIDLEAQRPVVLKLEPL